MEAVANLFSRRNTEEYTRENSESDKQYARIVWASLISSPEVARLVFP